MNEASVLSLLQTRPDETRARGGKVIRTFTGTLEWSAPDGRWSLGQWDWQAPANICDYYEAELEEGKVGT